MGSWHSEKEAKWLERKKTGVKFQLIWSRCRKLSLQLEYCLRSKSICDVIHIALQKCHTLWTSRTSHIWCIFIYFIIKCPPVACGYLVSELFSFRKPMPKWFRLHREFIYLRIVYRSWWEAYESWFEIFHRNSRRFQQILNVKLC